MPAVDVVIPTRDRQALVPDAIRSVLGQTHTDLRLWVVDSGSDPPLRLPPESADDGRVELLRSERPLSAGRARNLGLERGTAPVTAFLDDDDRWRPRKLERELLLLERLPETVALVGSGAELHHPRGGWTIEIPEPGPDPRTKILEHPVFWPSSTIVRRSALEAVGLFPAFADRTEDWALWLALVERFEVAVLPEALTVRVDSGTAPERLLRGLEGYHRRVRSRVERLPPRRRKRILARQEFDRAVQVARMGQRRRAARMLLRALALNPRARLPLFHLLRIATGERAWSAVADYTRSRR